jgi:hypothetical protein
MTDLLFLVLALALFAASAWYVRACAWLTGAAEGHAPADGGRPRPQPATAGAPQTEEPR